MKAYIAADKVGYESSSQFSREFKRYFGQSPADMMRELLEQRIEQERLRAELEAAAKIQKLFWSKMPELGEGNHGWAISEPATSVGGDLNDVIPMPDASWLVYVADVAGKGLPAARIMAALSAKIRSIAPLHNEVDKLLARVNKESFKLKKVN